MTSLQRAGSQYMSTAETQINYFLRLKGVNKHSRE